MLRILLSPLPLIYGPVIKLQFSMYTNIQSYLHKRYVITTPCHKVSFFVYDLEMSATLTSRAVPYKTYSAANRRYQFPISEMLYNYIDIHISEMNISQCANTVWVVI